jgi:hypothetical protein
MTNAPGARIKDLHQGRGLYAGKFYAYKDTRKMF